MNLAGEIAQEYSKRQSEEGPIDDLMDLVQQIVAFHMKHNAEPEAVDLLMEVEDLDLLVEHVDSTNYKRTCLYLTAAARYLPGPDDMLVLDIAHGIYLKFDEYASALQIALFLDNLQKTLEAGMNRKYGEDPANHPRFDPEVWIEAAGPNNKGRVRGLGSGLTLSVGSCSSDAATHGCSFAQRESDPVQEGHNERLLRIEQSLQEVQQNTISERQKIEQTLQNFQASVQQSIQATLQQVMDAIGGQQGSRTRHTQGHHPSSSREADDDQALDNDFNPQAP